MIHIGLEMTNGLTDEVCYILDAINIESLQKVVLRIVHSNENHDRIKYNLLISCAMFLLLNKFNIFHCKKEILKVFYLLTICMCF